MSAQQQFVVVFDPAGSLPVGEIVEGDKITVARKRRVVLLPADSQMYYSAAPGFFYRPWGSGIHFDNMQPTRACPMLLAVAPQAPWIYWAMQVAPIRDGEPLHGRIRVVGNSSAGGMSAGMSQETLMVPLEQVQTEGKRGLVVCGRNHVSVTNDGMFALSLHGVCRNVRVLWSVVTSTSLNTEITPVVPV